MTFIEIIPGLLEGKAYFIDGEDYYISIEIPEGDNYESLCMTFYDNPDDSGAFDYVVMKEDLIDNRWMEVKKKLKEE